MMDRKNCWEFFVCGREPGGDKAEELGICPACLPGKYDSVNKGQYSGRFCWMVAGSFCEGKVAGTHARKLQNCIECEFLKYVNEREGWAFILTVFNLKNLSSHHNE